MNKFIISAFALAAISTGAFAASDDHGGNGKDSQAYVSSSNTEAFAVAPVTSKGSADEGSYLTWRQLR